MGAASHGRTGQFGVGRIAACGGEALVSNVFKHAAPGPRRMRRSCTVAVAFAFRSRRFRSIRSRLRPDTVLPARTPSATSWDNPAGEASQTAAGTTAERPCWRKVRTAQGNAAA